MKCDFCVHNCELEENKCGFCKARALQNGKNISMNYGQITSVAIDPIEKKPLYKFHPGSNILSVGSWGCNMSCPWCQNDSISRGPADYIKMSPEELVSKALFYNQDKKINNIGIAFTYNEPLISFEFVKDAAMLAHDAGLLNVIVSNGMFDSGLFEKLSSYIDAYNIDLKTINKEKYKSIGGDLDNVLENIKIAERNAHVEITTLIVPGFNDDEDEMELLAKYLAGINPEIALHVTRFFPAGRMKDAKPTPRKMVYDMCEIAKKHLKYVFPGNV